MYKVKLPLYDENGFLETAHLEIDSSFFTDPANEQEFGARIVENDDIPIDPVTEESVSEATLSEETPYGKFRVGWYEFIKLPSATTHIAYIGESSFYLPEEGVTPEDFFDAVSRAQAWHLVRSVD
jgi:hypothetical protein